MMGLNELIAERVMGWRLNPHYGDKQHYPYQMYERPNMDAIPTHEFQPRINLGHALASLEQAAQGKGYSIYKFPEEKKPYDVELEIDKRCTDAETLPLAMCICALRACSVDEREISKALAAAS